MASLLIDIRRAEDLRDVIHRAVQALAEGKLVAFPTETVYGLAASALHPDGVARLFEAKGRQNGHPLALGIKSADEALDYAPDMPPLAWRLARRCWPGPVTLVVDAEHPESLVRRLPESVQRHVVPSGTVGLRVPAHATIHDVMRMLTGPLALTSANRSGEGDATTAQQVVDQLGEAVSLVLDDGPSRYGQPSSVVRVDEKKFEILREGVVPRATLQRMSSFMLLLVCTGNTCRSPMAEVLAQKLIADRLGCSISELDQHGVVVMSAGLAAMAGGRPSPDAVHVMRDAGLRLEDHESQPLTDQLIRHADVIFTMTSAHRQAIVSHWPESARRTWLLRRDGGDISDPIGGTQDVYRQCAGQIQGELEARVVELDLEGAS
ncbi:MAG: L-threonylcarbamoyladenylate synthase [Pirellulales bacterium]